MFTSDSSKANLTPTVNGAYEKRFPQLLHIELSSTCNFRCEHCYKSAISNGVFADFDYLKRNIYQKFKGIIPIIHFTGGEATLHKQFRELVNLFSNGYLIQLTTNGSTIVSYPIDTFKRIQSIDISLYGLSAEDYKNNTGNADAFGKVCDGLKTLKNACIDFRTTLVLNNDNWSKMEDYIKLAIDLGATSFGFALPMISGKLMNTNTDKWQLATETKKSIYRSYRYICDKYKTKIRISDWYRMSYSDMWKTYPENDSLRCGAGKTNWWMSEKFVFRPCAFLPDEYISLNYDTWSEYISNQYEIDWTKARTALEAFATDNKTSIVDICSIFRK